MQLLLCKSVRKQHFMIQLNVDLQQSWDKQTTYTSSTALYFSIKEVWAGRCYAYIRNRKVLVRQQDESVFWMCILVYRVLFDFICLANLISHACVGPMDGTFPWNLVSYKCSHSADGLPQLCICRHVYAQKFKIMNAICMFVNALLPTRMFVNSLFAISRFLNRLLRNNNAVGQPF